MQYIDREVSTSNIKYLSSVFHLLQKVSKEFIIEKTLERGLMLRALNDPNSVYAAIELRELFWSNIHEDDNSQFSCKLSSKLVCSIFRNLKRVKNLVLQHKNDENGQHIIFQFNSFDGSRRTHFFPYQDCEILNPVFDEEECHFLQTQPKVFISLIDHMHQIPEFMIEASQNAFSLRSYNLGSNTDSKRYLATDLSIDIREFDIYQTQFQHSENSNKVEIVFVSKEFRALLAFCEIADILSLMLYFRNGGSPMKFQCDHNQLLFRVDLVLATLESFKRSETRFTPSISEPAPPKEMNEQPLFSTEDQECQEVDENEYQSQAAVSNKTEDTWKQINPSKLNSPKKSKLTKTIPSIQNEKNQQSFLEDAEFEEGPNYSQYRLADISQKSRSNNNNSSPRESKKQKKIENEEGMNG